MRRASWEQQPSLAERVAYWAAFVSMMAFVIACTMLPLYVLWHFLEKYW